MSVQQDSTVDLPPILTFLTPYERLHVDAVGQGYYQTVHRENLEDLIHELKARPIHAVLVSVSCTGNMAARVASMVREFPRVPALALLSELEGKTPHAVLALGQSGVRRLVDVRLPAGWRELRGALMANTGESGHRAIRSQLAIDLVGASEDCTQFFDALFMCPPRVCNVRLLASYLNVVPSTLMSRFFRARIPAPKVYLSMARLVRAAKLFENNGFSIANVADHLDYSSPQSFGRHVRSLLQLTASEFRSRYDGAGMFERFRSELILPHMPVLRELRPLLPPPGWDRRGRATDLLARTLPATRAFSRRSRLPSSTR